VLGHGTAAQEIGYLDARQAGRRCRLSWLPGDNRVKRARGRADAAQQSQIRLARERGNLRRRIVGLRGDDRAEEVS